MVAFEPHWWHFPDDSSPQIAWLVSASDNAGNYYFLNTKILDGDSSHTVYIGKINSAGVVDDTWKIVLRSEDSVNGYTARALACGQDGSVYVTVLFTDGGGGS